MSNSLKTEGGNGAEITNLLRIWKLSFQFDEYLLCAVKFTYAI